MSQTTGRIVLIDDDQEMREMLQDYLVRSGYEVIPYENGQSAFDDISKGVVGLGYSPSSIDSIVTDLNMPGMNGIEFIQRTKELYPHLPILLITAYGTIDSAVEATKVGAYSYIIKPFKLNEFEVTLNRAVSHSRLEQDNETLRAQLKGSWMKGSVIGKSKVMKDVMDLVDRVSNASANVLITGESGTGKEVIAKAIHDSGTRKNKPMVAVNCSAIPESLMESELFGHIKGAFTGAYADKIGLFEEASGGTIFLDEIGDLPLALQAKLLRVLQEKSVKPVGSTKSRKIDVRIIAATHKDLAVAIKDNEFREDLYYRLSVIPVRLPSLRERKEDIPLLAEHFLKKFASINNTQARGFTSGALKKLIMNDWTGNVRELENMVERLVVLSSNKYIDANEIMFHNDNPVEAFYYTSTNDWPTLESLERRYIEAVLDKVSGKKEKAANILGINRRTLYRKEKEYNEESAIH